MAQVLAPPSAHYQVADVCSTGVGFLLAQGAGAEFAIFLAILLWPDALIGAPAHPLSCEFKNLGARRAYAQDSTAEKQIQTYIQLSLHYKGL